jgi:hypothetical protein
MSTVEEGYARASDAGSILDASNIYYAIASRVTTSASGVLGPGSLALLGGGLLAFGIIQTTEID